MSHVYDREGDWGRLLEPFASAPAVPLRRLRLLVVCGVEPLNANSMPVNCTSSEKRLSNFTSRLMGPQS